MACVAQRSWKHSTLGLTVACKALRCDRIESFESLLVPYSSLDNTPWPKPVVAANVKTSKKPVQRGICLATPLYVAVPDVEQTDVPVSFQVSVWMSMSMVCKQLQVAVCLQKLRHVRHARLAVPQSWPFTTCSARDVIRVIDAHARVHWTGWHFCTALSTPRASQTGHRRLQAFPLLA